MSSSNPTRPKAFKPPGPAKKLGGAAATATSKVTHERRPVTSRKSRASDSPGLRPSSDSEDMVLDDQDEFDTTLFDAADLDALDEPAPAMPIIGKALTAGEGAIVDNNTADNTTTAPGISQTLLQRLVHQHLENKHLKLGKVASQMLLVYVDMFVREAVARSTLDKLERSTDAVRNDPADLWLNFEDLERVTPGLLLDF